jgi:hypothetical protein
MVLEKSSNNIWCLWHDVGSDIDVRDFSGQDHDILENYLH